MIKVIAWDFDGVLNRSWADGAHAWQRDFERDLGASLQSFHEAVFADGFHRIITGAEDVRERVASWVAKSQSTASADEVLDYWFAKDARADDEMLALMQRLDDRGVRQVIATNNEARRTAFIRDQMGFGARVETIFASGHIGAMKPDSAFFDHVSGALGVPPADILLVDDREPNVIAAQKSGWHGFHFTDATRGALADYISARLT